MKFYLLIFVIFLFINNSYHNNLLSQDLYINEMMSANQNFLLDEDGDDSDWLEIFNSGDETILLKDYYLTDDETNINKWQFPNVDIKPNEYLVVYCSNKNKRNSKSNLHTNFAINNEGENIILSKNGEVVDLLPAIALLPNTSYGVLDKVNDVFEIFKVPTPGSINVANPILNEVIFSHNTGIYPVSFNLKLDLKYNDPNHKIRYTIDGNTPNANSPIYEYPLYLDENMYSDKNINQIKVSPEYHNFTPQKDILKLITLKTAIFDNLGNLKSEIKTNTFIIKDLIYNFLDKHYIKQNNNNEIKITKPEIFHLPIISLTADSLDLFDFEKGIMVPGKNFDPYNYYWSGNYHMRGDEWERKAHFNFIDTNGIVLNYDVNIRIHGNSTRTFVQKPFRIKSVQDNFNYDFFDSKTISSFKNLVLSPFNNSWLHVGLEDYISNKMAQDFRLPYIAQKPCIVFLNGEFWGFYYLQERLDEHYLESNFDANRDKLDLIETWKGYVSHGEDLEFNKLYKFIENNSLNLEENYNYVKSRLDIDNFINYNLFQIIIANQDWPANNVKMWLDKNKTNKWMFLYYDGGASLYNEEFKVFENALDSSKKIDWPTNFKSTLFLRKLLENNEFKTKFFEKFQNLIFNEYNIERYLSYKNVIFNKIQSVIPLIIDRYGFTKSYIHWEYTSKLIDTFIVNRQCNVLNQFNNYFINNQINFNCRDFIYENNDSINNINDNELIINTQIFPNPSEDFITIYSNCINNNLNLVESYSVEIIDILGQIVYSENFEINYKNSFIQTINISHLSKGQYFFKLNTKMKPNEIINQNDNNSPINSHNYFTKFIKN